MSARDELRVEYQVHERIWVGIDGDEFPFDPQASVTVRATDQAGLTSTVTLEARRSALIGRPAPGEAWRWLRVQSNPQIQTLLSDVSLFADGKASSQQGVANQRTLSLRWNCIRRV